MEILLFGALCLVAGFVFGLWWAGNIGKPKF